MSAPGPEMVHLQFLLSVLSHSGVIAVNWNKVSDENGIGYARNGASKFKDILKKYGYKFEKNTVKRAGASDGDNDNSQATSVPATPKAKKSKKEVKAPRQAKKASAEPRAKRRKVKDFNDIKDDDSESSDAVVAGKNRSATDSADESI